MRASMPAASAWRWICQWHPRWRYQQRVLGRPPARTSPPTRPPTPAGPGGTRRNRGRWWPSKAPFTPAGLDHLKASAAGWRTIAARPMSTAVVGIGAGVGGDRRQRRALVGAGGLRRRQLSSWWWSWWCTAAGIRRCWGEQGAALRLSPDDRHGRPAWSWQLGFCPPVCPGGVLCASWLSTTLRRAPLAGLIAESGVNEQLGDAGGLVAGAPAKPLKQNLGHTRLGVDRCPAGAGGGPAGSGAAGVATAPGHRLGLALVLCCEPDGVAVLDGRPW